MHPQIHSEEHLITITDTETTEMDTLPRAALLLTKSSLYSGSANGTRTVVVTARK